MNILEGAMMRRHFGAWIRYGDPITPDQVEFAAEHYASAILQPWEQEAAAQLKRMRPDMTVLTYKCLSSTRSYEPGPHFTSGLSHAEAEEMGEHLFAHRADGSSRIEWKGYPGHWQMAVWEPEYRERWVANVVAEMRDSVWDGVMADNDVFEDYYGLRFPLAGGRDLREVRTGLNKLIRSAGQALNAAGKILVPNIAESRRERGRWRRHAAYGGGYEEVWLAWGPDQHLSTTDVLAQAKCLRGPGLTLVRVASDGTDSHPNVRFGLAAFWIFGAGRTGTSFTATAHDQYSGIPHVPPLTWDLGTPTGNVRKKGHARHRSFSHGWAGANLGLRGDKVIELPVPAGLIGEAGDPAPPVVTLEPRQGAIFRRP
jgi:hypothetical protein